ncbi:MAG: hydroxylamine reductase [Armatimonadetes bacterium]|nr:hydroxylamine reductase [Armatimonadota bacterium]
MFCFQCEQTAMGTGCTKQGVCGKDEVTAKLQDLLVHMTKGISMYASRARSLGAINHEVDVFTIEALFATVTNVDFDPQRIAELICKAESIRGEARALYEDACRRAGKTPELLDGPALFEPAKDVDGMATQAVEIGILARKEAMGEDIASLQEIITYGLKGAAAYADHAQILGKEDPAVYGVFHEGLNLLTRPNSTVDDLLSMTLKVGELNLKVMELLDAANTGAYGHPTPTQVRITPVKGKAIVVSGHDLRDLEMLLKQTEGKGINIYTHGEMLPAHGYPKLKAYSHLVGNYGGAWQDQVREFDTFPGAILMTTNCIQKPRDSYKDRLFTTGLVAMPGVRHIATGTRGEKDFTPVIEAALEAPGFAEDEAENFITVGFGHNAVTTAAPTIIDAVKGGAIRHFFLIGGCDGAKPGRNYYTEFAQLVPENCVILTLACGKYRFNKLDFGTIDGIPRLIDIGQCNDAYSAIQIALALSKAFGVGVNELPLSLILSWYEQKAVAILLTLLALGIKNIRLGPSLPAFVSPAVLNTLVEKFSIKPISTPQEDLKAILG